MTHPEKRLYQIILVSILVFTANTIIIEIDNDKQFCLSNLENDHSSINFFVKFFSATSSESEIIQVDVNYTLITVVTIST